MSKAPKLPKKGGAKQAQEIFEASMKRAEKAPREGLCWVKHKYKTLSHSHYYSDTNYGHVRINNNWLRCERCGKVKFTWNIG